MILISLSLTIFKKSIKEKVNKKLSDLYKKTVWNGLIRTLYISYISYSISANTQSKWVRIPYTFVILTIPLYMAYFLLKKEAKELDI